MKICALLFGHDFPPDIRVEMEARSLLEAGNELIVVCDQQRSSLRQEVWKNIKIIRIPTGSKLQRKFRSFWSRTFFFNPWWYKELARLIQEENIEALHVHDLPLAGTAIKLGKDFNIPVVLDLHENYPAAVKIYNDSSPFFTRLIGSLVNYPSRWDAYETRMCLEAFRVIVVVDEARDRLLEKGVPVEKIVILENTPDVDYFLGLSIYQEIKKNFAGNFVISYIGGFGGSHRGLDTAVEAMPSILKKIPNAILLLVGDGPIKPKLIELSKELGVRDKIVFVQWQPFEKVPTYIELSSICIVPHKRTFHTETTSPHKLFQYMLMGKPVVVSDCKPLARVVSETGAGVVFEAGNPESLAQAILSLEDDKVREEMGKRGRKAVLEKYNWRVTSAKLLSIYENIK